PGCTEGGDVAVEEGFEPSKGCPLPAFEAGAIGHLATPPRRTLQDPPACEKSRKKSHAFGRDILVHQVRWEHFRTMVLPRITKRVPDRAGRACFCVPRPVD